MATQPINDSQDHRELVQVFETAQESEALVVQGLLDSAGIETLIASEVGPQDVLPGVGSVFIRVPAESADEARRLIEDYRSSNESEVIAQDQSDQSDSSDESLA
ncbi:MAG: hypothetical protein JWO13_88 [Acidobacteriales bacterium]|nr:hypothetical protein [Terriglobales bacterium]